MVTTDLLVQLFGLDPAGIKILPSRLHPAWEDQHQPAGHLPALLADNGSPFGFIVSLIAARKLRHCISLGSALALIGAAAGILLLLVMLLMGRLGSFGALQMLLFEEIFLVIYWLYEKNMRL